MDILDLHRSGLTQGAIARKLGIIPASDPTKAGRLSRPQGKLALTMNANRAVKKDLLNFMDVLQKAV